MRFKNIFLILLSVLMLSSMLTSVSAEENPKIAFVVIGANEAYMVNQAAEGTDANVTVYYSARDSTVNVTYNSFQDMDLSSYDVVFVYPNTAMLFLGADVRDEIDEAITNTVDPATPVIDLGFGTGNVNLTEHPYIEAYVDNAGTENIRRLISYIAITFCDADGDIEEPIVIPENGIYHPDANLVFEDLDSYLEWYSSDDGIHHVYDSNNITIGLSFFDSNTGTKGNLVVDATIRELESSGVNVIPAFRPTVLYEDTPKFFEADGEWLPDAFIDFGYGVWVIPVLNKNTTYLQEAGVPVINAVMYSQSLDEWANGTTGSAYDFQYQIPLMEIGGHIESIVVSAKVADEKYGVELDTPIPAQVDWMIDRTLNWVKLQIIENEEKKVAIIYYNHAPGKQDVMTASNLDVAPSIANLVECMDENGYDLGEEVPNSTRIRELVQEQGRNIGNWAPGEMEELVNNYDVELLPVEQYMEWFSELPQDKQDEVISTWGEAPGDCMVYENSSGQYFVFPKISLGNVVLVPQPTRGGSDNDSLLYHDQTLPPSHQYIAFYMWLDKQFEADAVINMGRHGTQEWLAGKGVGLSIEDCWPAIMIQDMPSIYIYEVGGIGEGIQAKRRGNAVIVDHLTPPIVSCGLYGNLSTIHLKMHLYEEEESESLKEEYKKSIIELYGTLGFDTTFNISKEELSSYNETEFESFVLEGPVHDYLHELAQETMTYGLHVLGEPAEGDALVAMVYSIVSDDLIKSISKVVDDEHLLDTAHQPNVITELIEDVIINGSSPDEAVMNKLNISGTVTTEVVATAISDEDGNYTLENIPNGNYTLTSFKYIQMGSMGMWFIDETDVTVQDGQDISDFNVTTHTASSDDGNNELETITALNILLQRADISGKTLGSSRMGGTQPYVNVTVVLTDDKGELVANTTSDEDGNYTLENIPNGNYTLTSFKYIQMGSMGMWFIDETDVTVQDGQDISDFNVTTHTASSDDGNNELETITALNILLQRADISGKTLGSSRMGGTQPYVNVTVVLTDDKGELVANTTSDEDGNYTLENIPNGNYTLTSFKYIQMGSMGMWFIDETDVTVQDGQDISDFNVTTHTASSDDGNNELETITALNILLQRADISGKTLGSSRMGGTQPYVNVTVVLTKETVKSSEEAAEIIETLNYASEIAENIAACSCELHSVIDALDGKYITPGLGDDPIRSPEVIPTGRNFYAFNPNIIPTEEAWNVGKQLVDDFLEEWLEEYGEYPEKVGFVLWSSETGRHKGVMEAEILYLLGVEPVWDDSNVEGVRLIDSKELGRPRIDVVVTMSGVYRDDYNWQVELMDMAARLAAESEDDTEYENYVKTHSDEIYDLLMATGNYTEEEADLLSKSRIFGPAPGTWGVGEFRSAVERGDSWDNDSILADLYVSSMSNIYVNGEWGGQEVETFREVLSGTDALLFSRSGNDGRGSSSVVFDHVYEFYGGFATAVRDISGEDPVKFIVDLKDADEATTEAFNSYLAKELLSTYYNPLYISGLMSSGYAGAAEISSIIEDLAGLQYTLPGDISGEMWEQMYNIYVEDSYNLGMDEWYANENPWAKQAIESKMLEVAMKDYWDADDAILENLANEYIQSVVEYGVTCCHHTCGFLELNEWAVTHSSVDEETLKEFERLYEEATQKDLDISDDSTEIPEQNDESSSSDSDPDTYSKVYSGNESVIEAVNATNTTIPTNTTVTEDAAPSVGSDGGRSSSGSSSSSTESSSSSTSKTQKAYEVTVANEPEQTETSGTTVIAIIGAVGMTGLVGVGYFKQNPEVFTNIINALKLLRRK
uniref:Cobaltochelatase n=1 Tax=Methanococcus maripaludis (strain C6 / ATCC BAA-1332) TaxID=444158 RepID=A9A7L6_METM6